MVNAVLKPGMFPHMNYNYYYHGVEAAFCRGAATTIPKKPGPPAMPCLFPPMRKTTVFANGLSIMAYMNIKDVAPWMDTFNTVSREGDRGEDYEAFKKKRRKELLDMVERRFPVIRQCIQSYYVATPLSFRDYIGTSDGSMYGVLKGQ